MTRPATGLYLPSAPRRLKHAGGFFHAQTPPRPIRQDRPAEPTPPLSTGPRPFSPTLGLSRSQPSVNIPSSAGVLGHVLTVLPGDDPSDQGDPPYRADTRGWRRPAMPVSPLAAHPLFSFSPPPLGALGLRGVFLYPLDLPYVTIPRASPSHLCHTLEYSSKTLTSYSTNTSERPQPQSTHDRHPPLHHST